MRFIGFCNQICFFLLHLNPVHLAFCATSRTSSVSCDFAFFVGVFRFFLSVDFGLAWKFYYLATQDIEFLKSVWNSIYNTCIFWECRFQQTDATPNGTFNSPLSHPSIAMGLVPLPEPLLLAFRSSAASALGF